MGFTIEKFEKDGVNFWININQSKLFIIFNSYNYYYYR